jgi:hypothetical protein
MHAGAIYRARDDIGELLCDLPAEECTECGNICPDVEKIDALDSSKVPSSIRLRCARIRAAN